MTDPVQLRTEQSLELLRSGYLFISRGQRKAKLTPGSDTPVSRRLLGKRATAVPGEEGARLSYDNDRVKRAGTTPNWRIC